MPDIVSGEKKLNPIRIDALDGNDHSRDSPDQSGSEVQMPFPHRAC